MPINFNKFAQEGNTFVKNLAERLGHPEEISRTGIILRSTMHTLRDRLTTSESLHVIAQLPMFLKAVYVDEWKDSESVSKISTIEEFTEEVKKKQDQFGEQEFSWSKSTEEIVKTVFDEMETYLSKGEIKDILAQLPAGLQSLFDR